LKEDSKVTTLKIVSDGTPTGTKIVTDDGQEVKNVTHVFWSMRADGTSCAEFTIEPFPVEITCRGAEADVDISDIVEHFETVRIDGGSGRRMTWKMKGVEEK
jgi:hypothetical protein